MEIREVDRSDEARVHQHWEIGRLANAESELRDFYVPWESAWRSYTVGRDDVEMLLLAAYDGDRMVGAARTDLNLLDNLHAATMSLYVPPERQREGIGTALEAACVETARRHDRRVLMAEAFAPPASDSPGVLFAAARGYVLGIEDGMKLVDLIATEPSWDALEAKTLARRGDYRVITWQDHVPDEHLDDYCALSESFFEEAPIGEMELEREVWDARRVSERESRNAQSGRHELSAGAVSPDGHLVAVTEVVVSDFAPWRGYQSGTLVAREHRGHQLGLAIKLANQRQVRTAFPELRLLLTGNADVNAPMNAVNDALGYRVVERCVEVQKDI